MNIGILNLFGKKSSKPNAFVFVDYEHWYVSMYRKYGMRPRIRSWRDELAKEYTLKEMLFFGDFSNPGMRYEIPRIREVTNMVIETQNTSAYYKKDFTDFIMLDYIYQKALLSKGVDTFIIFTGDGHFSSVVKFLHDKCNKKVIIYAVKDGLSGVLKSVADVTYEVPGDEDIKLTYYSMIALKMKELTVVNEEGQRKRSPTFMSVVNSVAEYYKADIETVKASMNEMVAAGYVRQEFKYVAYNKRIKTVILDEEKLKADGVSLIEDADMLLIPGRGEKRTSEKPKTTEE